MCCEYMEVFGRDNILCLKSVVTAVPCDGSFKSEIKCSIWTENIRVLIVVHPISEHIRACFYKQAQSRLLLIGFHLIAQ